MNPAAGSEVYERACADVERFIARLGSAAEPMLAPPPLAGDVREAYVASFCAQLLAAEGISPKRLRAAAATDLKPNPAAGRFP